MGTPLNRWASAHDYARHQRLVWPDAAAARPAGSGLAGRAVLNSVTLFEIRFGLALLASGRRKKLLHERFEELLQDDLQNRVLLFDTNAAAQAAQLAADRKAGGRPVDMRDTFIAGIALAHKAILATRNIRHFSDLSVTVVNPWDCQA